MKKYLLLLCYCYCNLKVIAGGFMHIKNKQLCGVFAAAGNDGAIQTQHLLPFN